MRATHFQHFSVLRPRFILLFLWIFSLFPFFSAVSADQEQFEKREWGESHMALLAPQGWHIILEKTEDFLIFHLSPEPLDSSSANYDVGLAINILRDVPSVMGQKPSEYADNLISQIRERSEKEIVIQITQSSPFKIYRVEYSLLAERESIHIINILKANDATGTLYMMAWQAPESKGPLFSQTREKILNSIRLDPAF